MWKKIKHRLYETPNTIKHAEYYRDVAVDALQFLNPR